MTVAIPDIDQMLDDLKALIENAGLGFKKVGVDLQEEEYSFAAMPLCDVRLPQVEPENLAGGTKHFQYTFEVEVAAFHLAERRSAARLIRDLVRAIMKLVAENPHFSGTIETTLLGPVRFMTVRDEKTQAFTSAAILQFVAMGYADQS